jgi:putative ATP-dependent endonuclease of the OLD family
VEVTMRLARVHILNFRCLTDLELEFDDVTVLVGANSTGKSTALDALRWLFEGGALDLEDLAGCDPDATASVGATFVEFNDEDREALGSYVVGEEATFWRTWSAAEGEKLTGRGRAFPLFEDVRREERAMPMRQAYAAIRSNHPELGLPTAASQAAVEDAMRTWEEAHPESLEESRVSATHLFGFTGGSRLNGRFDFVLIPAISDPDLETRDARGTLLRQLLDRAMGDQTSLKERLSELEKDVADRMHEIVVAEGGEALDSLSESVTGELERLVPGGQVALEANEPLFRMPPFTVDMRVIEGGLDLAVGRQGHGFQRALLIAVVQQLASLRPDVASVDGEGESGEEVEGSSLPVEAPALFLALEEPELYQHPAQARHFASTLASLTEGSGIQVSYATHSEHFVDPARFERLRRFRRKAGAAWPTGEVTQATVAGVAARLEGVVESAEVALRIRMTLRRKLAEAVFARAAIIVEGHSDAGFLHGLADRSGGFDAEGIAVVSGMGKSQILVPWAILTELGIPTYVVFDGDAGRADRMRADGKDEAAIAAAVERTQSENRQILSALGAEAVGAPETSVAQTHAVFHDVLETEVAEWKGYAEELERSQYELGDWRGKSEDGYRLAAAGVQGGPPQVFLSILENVSGLA